MVEDPWEAQEAYLNGAFEADLADLAQLSRLMSLRVDRAGRVVGDARQLPLLELLSVDAAVVELAGTGDHTALWDLSLRGVRHPVPSPGLRGLTRLAIAGVDVPDVESLHVPNVLVADADQVDPLLRGQARASGCLVDRRPFLADRRGAAARTTHRRAD
ncbi:hypothetical protein [Actinokineospora sp. NBRC 105648]|uniref:hypothetical protein n=1 Tax=Actinokineospora sp. NBRC 105648 TaxID=3032206 RepID=UPI00255683DF|nr:hypothetical protein [Actinokineospora sp. NBRC 105648]